MGICTPAQAENHDHAQNDPNVSNFCLAQDNWQANGLGVVQVPDLDHHPNVVMKEFPWYVFCPNLAHRTQC